MPEKIIQKPLEKKNKIKISPLVEGVSESLQGKGLDASFNANKHEFRFLQEWTKKLHPGLKIHELISRKEWNALAGKFIKNNQLYLPEDLHVGEIGGIIKRINRETFGDDIPEDAASIRLRSDLRKTITSLLQMHSEHYDKKNEKSLQKAIKQYVKLYESLGFGDFSLSKNENAEKIEGDLEKLEQGMVEKLKKYLREAIFEGGNKHFSLQMPYLDEKDVERQGPDFRNILEDFGIQVSRESKTIREIVSFETLKKGLSDAKNEPIEKQVQLQKAIIDDLMTHIRMYDSDIPDGEFEGGTPELILQTKKMRCIGKSMLMHGLLQDLGIKHDALHMPSHIALSVILADGSEWFCDSYYNTRLISMQSKNQTKVGGYILDAGVKSKMQKIEGFAAEYKKAEVDDGIMSDFLNVWAATNANEGNLDEALQKYRLALRMGTGSADLYGNIANVYFQKSLLVKTQENIRECYVQASYWMSRAHELLPTNISYIDQLILFEKCLGNEQKTKEFTEKKEKLTLKKDGH